MRQLPVADKNAQAAVIEESFVCSRYAIDDPGEGKSVIGATPLRSLQRDTGRKGTINVGVRIRALYSRQQSRRA